MYSDRVELGFNFACGIVVENLHNHFAIHCVYNTELYMYIIYKSCKCDSIENVSDVFTELKKVENILVMLFEKKI